MQGGRIIPAAEATVRVEDATLDLLCFDHAARVLGDRRAAGKLAAYVEATYAANPGLAAHGPILPLGLVVALPEFAVEEPTSNAVRLWD